MTLVLELTPETEAFLANEARALGTSPERAAEAALAELAATRQQKTIEDRVAGMQALIDLARQMPRNREAAGLGPLPDDAVAQVYEERENAQR